MYCLVYNDAVLRCMTSRTPGLNAKFAITNKQQTIVERLAALVESQRDFRFSLHFKEQRRSKMPRYTVQHDISNADITLQLKARVNHERHEYLTYFRATVQSEETRRKNTHI